jgi:hypothetical protein
VACTVRLHTHSLVRFGFTGGTCRRGGGAGAAGLGERLIAEGIEAGTIQYPFYAPRGEFRIQDPDGYVIMITHT